MILVTPAVHMVKPPLRVTNETGTPLRKRMLNPVYTLHMAFPHLLQTWAELSTHVRAHPFPRPIQPASKSIPVAIFIFSYFVCGECGKSHKWDNDCNKVKILAIRTLIISNSSGKFGRRCHTDANDDNRFKGYAADKMSNACRGEAKLPCAFVRE